MTITIEITYWLIAIGAWALLGFIGFVTGLFTHSKQANVPFRQYLAELLFFGTLRALALNILLGPIAFFTQLIILLL